MAALNLLKNLQLPWLIARLKNEWLNRQLAEIRYRLRLQPWPLSLGAALLGISLLALLAMVVRQKLELDQLQQSVVQMRQQMPPHQDSSVEQTPQAALNSFYQLLPPEADAPRLVGIVLKAATDQGITPDKVEYQLSRNTNAAFSRYQLTLPMHADYVAVRKFSIQVLNTLPNAALSEMSFRRDDSGEGMVEARLRITLYMGLAQR